MKGIVYMTGGQFAVALETLGWDKKRAAELLGQDTRRIADWLDDERDIPSWVPLYLTALTVRPAMDLVLQAYQHQLHDQNRQIAAMEGRR